MNEHQNLQHNGISETKEKSHPKLTCYAAWSALFASFAGLWQYGYAIGSINAVYVPLNKAIRQHYQYRYNVTVSSHTVDAIWVICSAAFPFGGIIGSLLVGVIVRRFGRLHGMVLGHGITTVMAVMTGLSGVLRSPELIILSRIGIGISSASIGTGIVIMYIVEVSPRHLRGAFGATVSGGIAFGMLMANIFGLPEVFGNEELWPLLFSLVGLPSLLFLFLHKTMALSPRKLFIEDKNEEKAADVLRRLNGVDDVTETMKELRKEVNESESSHQMTVLELLRSKKLRFSTISAVVVGGSLQLTGLNGVSFNMNKIFRTVGIAPDKVYYFSIGVTVAIFAMQLFTTRLTVWFRRKQLLITGYVIQGFSLVLLTVSMETQELSNAMTYITVVASLGFWVGFCTGPGPLSFLVMAEFFDQTSRSAAITLCNLVVWTCFGFVVIATPYMMTAIRGYTFLPYGIIAFLAAIYIRINVPETKNLSFSEIQRSFRRGNDQKKGFMEEAV